MAGTGVGKFSSTAGNNTSNMTTNFAENMAPSNVNNAARELMAHIYDMYKQLGDGYFEFGDGDATYTVARSDADTITITSSSDISSIYFPGRKIRITDGGANVVEGTIASSSHSSTTQTVNLTGISLASGTPTKVELGIDTAAFGGRIILDDDGDTYIEAPTDDQIDIYLGGNAVAKIAAGEVSFNENSANTNFRVESNGNANMLVVDGGDDDVRIGTATTFGNNDAGLKVKGGITIGDFTADSAANNLMFVKSRNTTVGSQTIVSDDDEIGRISFKADDGDDTSYNNNVAAISSQIDGTPGTNDTPGRLIFETTPDGARVGTEKMRITSAGKIGIGTNAPNQLLTLVKAQNSDTAIRIANGTGGTAARASIFLDVDSGGAQLMAIDDGFSTSGAYIADGVTFVSDTSMANGMTIGTRANDNNAHLRFYTKDAERMRISGAGNVGIGNSTMSSFSFAASTRLVIGDGAGDEGMTIYSGNASASNIAFADGTSGNARGEGIISYLHNENSMRFFTSATERMKITSDGHVRINTTTSEETAKFCVGTTQVVAEIRNENASYGSSNSVQSIACKRASIDSYRLLRGVSGNGSDTAFADNEFIFTGAGGLAIDGGSVTTGGADYAEMFEWKDGNSSSEDRRGYSVVLDGNQIIKATDSDDASKIIGVVSAMPVVIGDSDIDDKWKSKYLKDDFGNYVMEDYTVTEWVETTIETEEVLYTADDNETKDVLYTADDVETQDVLYTEEYELREGVQVGDVKEPASASVGDVKTPATKSVGDVKIEQKTSTKDHSYATDKIPNGITAPSDATVIVTEKDGAGNTINLKRKKLNPDWDDSKTYVRRKDRKEWDAIGLMGKLRILKGQPTGTNWIKMRDISDTIEEWLIR